jgi:hypothetical protein
MKAKGIQRSVISINAFSFVHRHTAAVLLSWEITDKGVEGVG